MLGDVVYRALLVLQAALSPLRATELVVPSDDPREQLVRALIGVVGLAVVVVATAWSMRRSRIAGAALGWALLVAFGAATIARRGAVPVVATSVVTLLEITWLVAMVRAFAIGRCPRRRKIASIGALLATVALGAWWTPDRDALGAAEARTAP